MRIKIKEPVVNYKGESAKNDDGSEFLWRDVFFGALNSYAPNEVMRCEDKPKCYQICKKVYDSDEPDLTVTETAFVLERIKKIYPPLTCGRAEELFNQPKEDKK